MSDKPCDMPTVRGRGIEGYAQHGCRVYWGHCGCDLFRGHDGTHVGLHVETDGESGAEVTVHLMGPGIVGWEYAFGEDMPR